MRIISATSHKCSTKARKGSYYRIELPDPGFALIVPACDYCYAMACLACHFAAQMKPGSASIFRVGAMVAQTVEWNHLPHSYKTAV